MADKPYVIFAPHIDDEVIGCWSLLSAGLVAEVYYFFDLDNLRMSEANYAAYKYGFKAVFVNSIDDALKSKVEGKILLLPSVKDNHPDHKMINQFGKTFRNEKMFYSIDMNNKFKVLDEDERDQKLNHLNLIYPSQKELWENDAKYYLFEGINKSDTRRTIWVSFQKEGIHSYPDAPSDVAFLRQPHRHMFHFRVEIEVFHDDREIEFIMFKRELEELYGRKTLELNYKSCEMLACDLEQYILTNYPGRCYNINVSEDNENGAVLYSGDW